MAEKFTTLLKAKAEKIPSASIATQLRFMELAKELIADAVSKGAKPLIGGFYERYCKSWTNNVK